ncbi:MAG: histidine kinase, partial [Rhodospirillales bacterium]|nr:histidine kinase [Rhodospirillales bacterium]
MALHLVSDGMMGLAYLSISLSILVFARRRRDLEIARVLPTVAVVFGFCGLQHLSQVATLWLPYYGAQGLFKLAAAIPSVLVAVLLWRLMPSALR